MAERSARGGLAAFSACCLLWLAVWGLFAPDRGFLQDEPWLLNSARARGFWRGLLWPGRTWEAGSLRALQGLPFTLAAFAPDPRLALQALYGLAWAANAAAAAALVRRWLPGRAAPAFAAAALVLTATGDRSVNHLSYTHAYLATAACFAALERLCAFAERGRRAALALGLALLLFGLLSYDGVLAVALLAPLALVAAGAPRRRLWVALLAWSAVTLPYLVLFVRSLARPEAYAARIVDVLPPGEWARRALRLFTFNFTPWSWSALFDGPYDLGGPQALPQAWAVGAGLAALLAFAGAWRLQAHDSDVDAARPKAWRLLFACVLLAAVADGATALVSAEPQRTQLASRVWASLALALLGALATARLRLPAAALAALFVGFGAQAGMASQNHYLTLWRRYARELLSIMTAAPPVPGGFRLLLPPAAGPQAVTNYQDVGGTFLAFLHAPPVWSWNPRSGSFDCETLQRAFACRNLARPECAQRRCAPILMPYDATLVLRYAPEQGRYVRDDVLPRALALAGGGVAPLLPQPEPETATLDSQAAALLAPRGLARWLARDERGVLALVRVAPGLAQDVTVDPRSMPAGGLLVVRGRQTTWLAPGARLELACWALRARAARLAVRFEDCAPGADADVRLQAGDALPVSLGAACAAERQLDLQLGPGRNDFVLDATRGARLVAFELRAGDVPAE